MELLTRSEKLVDLASTIAMLVNPHIHRITAIDQEQLDRMLEDLKEEMARLLEER